MNYRAASHLGQGGRLLSTISLSMFEHAKRQHTALCSSLHFHVLPSSTHLSLQGDRFNTVREVVACSARLPHRTALITPCPCPALLNPPLPTGLRFQHLSWGGCLLTASCTPHCSYHSAPMFCLFRTTCSNRAIASTPLERWLPAQCVSHTILLLSLHFHVLAS